MDSTLAESVPEVNNIEVIYNKAVQVLRGLSLAVPRGQIVALLGPTAPARAPRSRPSPASSALENGS